MSTEPSPADTSEPEVSLSNQRPVADTVYSAIAAVSATQVVLALALVVLITSSPVAAQQSGASTLCNNEAFANFFSGLFKATTVIGLSGALVVYKWQTFMEMISFSREQRKTIKQKKSDVVRGVAVLVLIGPAYTAIGSMMGLPGASCVFAL